MTTPEARRAVRIPGRSPTLSIKNPPTTGMTVENKAKRVWIAAKAVALFSESTASANIAWRAGSTMFVNASRRTPGIRCSHLNANRYVNGAKDAMKPPQTTSFFLPITSVR